MPLKKRGRTLGWTVIKSQQKNNFKRMKNIISCFLLIAFVAFKSYAQKPIEVSKFGFLVFATHEEFEDYGNFISKNTQGDIQKFHESIKFSSKGKQSYDEKNAGELATEEQQMDYSLNADGIVEMNGVLMKPIESNKFLLTMNEANLNEVSYQLLAKGEFDKATMNKIATNRPPEDELDLFEFSKNTPNGYEEAEPFAPTTGRFWGLGCLNVTGDIFNAETNTWTTNTQVRCCRYRFWIAFNCFWRKD